MIKLLIGGSPCTHWSIAQSKGRETNAKGIGWELFENYRIAKEKFQPDFFLYENNWSASSEIKEQIQKELSHELMRINSGLVSAQNRDRFYVFNWDVEQPEDKCIAVSDVITRDCLKPYNGGKFNRMKPDLTEKSSKMYQIGRTGESNGQAVRVYDIMGKSATLKSQSGGGGAKTGLYLVDDGVYGINSLGAERLQTLPDGYTAFIPESRRMECIGNGWTADVIVHILNGVLKDVPKNEKIVVLSMYDGIATGRYCLDKMGFTNAEYHAYEIDKYAIKVAMSNYPDIIQHGDAFQVREEGWGLNVPLSQQN